MSEASVKNCGCLEPSSDIGIYSITSPSGKVYIGQSSHLKKRKYEHFRLLAKGEHTNRFMQNVYNKYTDQMVFSVVEYLEDTCKLTEREQYWMDFFDSYESGMNLTPAAASTVGCVRTEEQRKVISDITSEYWGREENRLAQSLRKKKFIENNPDHKLKMSQIAKDLQVSRPELAERHSELMRERSTTPEAIEDFNERMSAWRATQSNEAMSERAKKSQVTKAKMGDEYWERIRLKTCLTKMLQREGDSGIAWQKSVTRNGTPRLDACARWQEVDGTHKLKRFSVTKYGLLPAHAKACAFRDAVKTRLITEYQKLL